MGDIFFSYNRSDREAVADIVHSLEKRGFSVWWDDKIPAGEDFRGFIDRKLNEAPAICVVWSAASAGSRWVIEEAEEGAQRGTLIPISIDGADIPRGFRGFQAVQLQKSLPQRQHDAEFNKLVERLERVATKSPDRKIRRRRPSPLDAPSARSQNLAWTIAFTFILAAFAGYDFVVDPGNVASLWFRLGLVIPAFLVFSGGYYLARRGWQLWLLNVIVTWAATALIIFQVRQFNIPEFGPEGFGTTLQVSLVLIASGVCVVQSHSSRFVSLAGAIAIYAATSWAAGATGLIFWITAMAHVGVGAFFLCMGGYLRERRLR